MAGTTTSTRAAPTTDAPPRRRRRASTSTVGGTVYADCTSGSPVLAGAPAAGWWVDDSNDPGEVEFKNGSQKVEVHVVCAGGGPQFFVEGPRADSSGGGGGSLVLVLVVVVELVVDSTSAGRLRRPGRWRRHAPVATTRAVTTRSGRDGGGHGSDD